MRDIDGALRRSQCAIGGTSKGSAGTSGAPASDGAVTARLQRP